MNNKIIPFQRPIKLFKHLTLALLLLPASTFAQQYQLIDLGLDVSPKDINNLGTIVGSRNTGTYTTTAFRYTSSAGIKNLPEGTIANAINNNDQIIGNTATGAFLYDGKLIYIGDDYTGQGINEYGQLSGGKAGTNPYRASPRPINPAIYDSATGQWRVYDVAKVYPRGTVQGVHADLYPLADINDSGFVVGTRRKLGISNSNFSFLMTPEFNAVTVLPIPYGGAATAINNQNMVVGSTGSNSATWEFSHAYLYDYSTGHLKDLGTLNGGLTSSAVDINELNQVVGTSWLSPVLSSLYEPEKYHAFIWKNGLMTDLNSLIPIDSGWILTAASAINDKGDIVGTGLLGGQVHGFLLTTNQSSPVPVAVPPVAIAIADVTKGKAPLTVNFSGSDSYDTSGSLVGYQWDFGDGSSSSELNPTHTYTVSGSYVTTLLVTDSQALTDSTQITIKATRRKGK